MTRTLAALTLAIACLAPALTMAQDSPSLTVTGDGRVAVAPDLATLRVGVSAEARDASDAVAEMSAKMAAILDRLAQDGIPDEDIRTTTLSVYAVNSASSRDGGGPRRFAARSEVVIETTELDRLGSLLDLLVSDGANEVGGIRFDLQDRGPALEQAQRNAVADAMATAETFADAAGLGLGPILEIREGGGAGGPAPMMEMAPARGSGVPIAAGDIEVTARVTLVIGLDAGAD